MYMDGLVSPDSCHDRHVDDSLVLAVATFASQAVECIVGAVFGATVYYGSVRFFLFFVAILCNIALNTVLKKAFEDPRPDGACLHSYGFPSSHSQTIAFVCIFVVLFDFMHTCRHFDCRRGTKSKYRSQRRVSSGRSPKPSQHPVDDANSNVLRRRVTKSDSEQEEEIEQRTFFENDTMPYQNDGFDGGANFIRDDVVTVTTRRVKKRRADNNFEQYCPPSRQPSTMSCCCAWIGFLYRTMLSFACIAAVGWSRIALGEHTFDQVVAGVLVGAIVAGALASFLLFARAHYQ